MYKYLCARKCLGFFIRLYDKMHSEGRRARLSCEMLLPAKKTAFYDNFYLVKSKTFQDISNDRAGRRGEEGNQSFTTCDGMDGWMGGCEASLP